ncbi:MAG: glycerol-3-phosphate 1-O-acyltransferase PlsY [Clostridia bacterium]|nr:glycerol-3-phosphate 1-O-acyltransferase PlsY [Clostridia bacterium]
MLFSFLSGHIGPYFSTVICILLCIILPYLLGSVNFALVISKRIYKDDIRNHGSGNAGMTNMLRTYGKGAAVGTLLFDMLKAVISVNAGYLIYPHFGIGPYTAGLFCIIGHMFPVFFKFKGGKGVATLAAMILSLDVGCFFFLFLVFVCIVATTKYVSLGSVVCCMLYPILTYRLAKAGLSGWGLGFPVLISFLVAALVIFMHRENIKRIINHTENKISFSKKNKEKKK